MPVPVGFDLLRDFFTWARENGEKRLAEAGWGESEIAGMRAALARGRLEPEAAGKLLDLFDLFGADLPERYRESKVRLEALVRPADADALWRAARLFAAAPGGEGEKTVPDAAREAVPFTDDPRAVILPRSSETADIFLNGFNPVTREMTSLQASLGPDGKARVLSRAVEAESGRATLSEWKRPFYRDGDTYFFASSVFEESSVFAVTFDPATAKAVRIERYPSYSAAGFSAPLRRSVLMTAAKPDKPGTSRDVKIFADGEHVELRLFEDDKGELKKVVRREFAAGELSQAGGSLFGMPYYVMPEHGLKLSFKKVAVAPGKSAYRVFVYHDRSAKKGKVERSGAPLTPQRLHAGNVNWLESAAVRAEGFQEGLRNGLSIEELRDGICFIRDAEGMAVASEILMRLYYDERSHMHVVNLLKLPDTKGLPLPPDTRVFPASRDLISGLLAYFSHGTASGFMTEQLLASARATHPQIPERFLSDLWLYAKHPTKAEAAFLSRGAGTPEELTQGYPVGKYRRILDESYSPLADTAASRAAQRERIRGLIANEPLHEGFRQYLGAQLELAENFDLLLLESGNLYYRNHLVRPVSLSDDGAYLKAVVDGNGKLVDLPRGGSGRAEAKPAAFSPAELGAEARMAPHHDDDPFLFSFRDEKKKEHGGSFQGGNLLMKGADGLYRVPAPGEVYDSMKGLLPLPADYLGELLPNGGIDEASFTWRKKDPVVYELGGRGYGFHGVNIEDFPPLKMIPYEFAADGRKFEIFLPQPHSKLAKALRERGYYVPVEEDLPKIAKYYLAVTRKGFMPARANLYIMPGLIQRDDGGILGFYTWKTEDLVVSSEIVGPGNDFTKWAAIRLFNTGRHEIAHSIKRGNPWITSLLYRAMALDGFTMDYGVTHLEEYFAVLTQHFFDHPLHRRRFPNGYRLLYTLMKLREAGVTWEGPNHKVSAGHARDIDGTHGALRILASGGDPFAAIRAAAENPPAIALLPPDAVAKKSPKSVRKKTGGKKSRAETAGPPREKFVPIMDLATSEPGKPQPAPLAGQKKAIAAPRSAFAALPKSLWAPAPKPFSGLSLGPIPKPFGTFAG